jgi:hypothetical protein
MKINLVKNKIPPMIKKITLDQLKYIYGKNWKFFTEKILNNCHCICTEESYSVTIVDYNIYLNDLNDIILKGKCSECKNPINRYLETGEIDKYQKRIQDIKSKN